MTPQSRKYYKDDAANNTSVGHSRRVCGIFHIRESTTDGLAGCIFSASRFSYSSTLPHAQHARPEPINYICGPRDPQTYQQLLQVSSPRILSPSPLLPVIVAWQARRQPRLVPRSYGPIALRIGLRPTPVHSPTRTLLVQETGSVVRGFGRSRNPLFRQACINPPGNI